MAWVGTTAHPFPFSLNPVYCIHCDVEHNSIDSLGDPKLYKVFGNLSTRKGFGRLWTGQPHEVHLQRSQQTRDGNQCCTIGLAWEGESRLLDNQVKRLWGWEMESHSDSNPSRTSVCLCWTFHQRCFSGTTQKLWIYHAFSIKPALVEEKSRSGSREEDTTPSRSCLLFPQNHLG